MGHGGLVVNIIACQQKVLGWVDIPTCPHTYHTMAISYMFTLFYFNNAFFLANHFIKTQLDQDERWRKQLIKQMYQIRHQSQQFVTGNCKNVS